MSTVGGGPTLNQIRPMQKLSSRRALTNWSSRPQSAAQKEKLSFINVANTGLSTGEKLIAEKHKAAGFKVRKTRVACFPLCEILNVHVEKEIHWLKIDVEGMEGQVMKSWAPSPVRPWIVVVESTRPNSPELSFARNGNQLLGVWGMILSILMASINSMSAANIRN